MNKKVALLGSVLLFAPVITQAKGNSEQITVTTTKQQVYLNQEDITRYAIGYNVNQSNYYRLRDLQGILNKTDKQFKIKYENKGAYGDIFIIRNQADAGVETIERYPTLKNLRVSVGQDKVYIDNVYTDVNSYKINGENYYKLRDICNLLGVTVNYNHETNSVELHTIGIAAPKIEQTQDNVVAEGKTIKVNTSEEMGKLLQEAVEKGIKTISFDYISPKYKIEEIEKYINSLDLTDAIYVNSYTYTYSMLSDNTVTKISFKFTTRVADEHRKEAEEVMNSWIKNNINSTDDEYTKVKKIHDFLVDSIDYEMNSETTVNGHSVFDVTGALLDRQAVCDGYSKSFNEIAKRVGLETKRVTGDAWNDSYNGSHAWNIVKVNGKWYHVDTTWDDPVSKDGKRRKTYEYFLKSDDYMAQSRTWDRNKTPKALENYQ